MSAALIDPIYPYSTPTVEGYETVTRSTGTFAARHTTYMLDLTQ